MMPLQNVSLAHFHFQKYTAILIPYNIPSPNHSSSIEFTIELKCVAIFHIYICSRGEIVYKLYGKADCVYFSVSIT